MSKKIKKHSGGGKKLDFDSRMYVRMSEQLKQKVDKKALEMNMSSGGLVRLWLSERIAQEENINKKNI